MPPRWPQHSAEASEPARAQVEAENKAKFDAGWAAVAHADGVVIPGGFGHRGTEGKIAAARYCREHKKPFLGICLGMQVRAAWLAVPCAGLRQGTALRYSPRTHTDTRVQVAVIEYARNVLGRADAHSAEFDDACSDPAIIFMPEGSRTHMGGTMRLGVRDTVLQTQDCHAARLYRPSGNTISERHRHRCAPPPHAQRARSGLQRMHGCDSRCLVRCRRATWDGRVHSTAAKTQGSRRPGERATTPRPPRRYEVNPDLVDDLEAAGLRFVGKDETGRRMEIVELAPAEHPYFVGVQYHPEFKSRPLKPSPVFHGLVAAATGSLDTAIRASSDTPRSGSARGRDLGIA